MNSSQTLSSAIEGLYATFSSYSLPSSTNPCLCCHSQEDEAKLHAKPLRELDCEDLREYANDALLTWGDTLVFKHFLPRIFDLLTTLPNPSLRLGDPEIIFSKFRHGDWRVWPENEQRAIKGYLHSIWFRVLGDPPHPDLYCDMESWICSLAQSVDDLNPFLDRWIADERLSASLALSSFILSSAVTHKKKTGRNAFWEGRDAQYQQLQEWINSPIVADKLDRAALSCEGNELAKEFEAARSMCRPDKQFC